MEAAIRIYAQQIPFSTHILSARHHSILRFLQALPKFYKYKSVNKYIFRELHLNEFFLCFFLEVYPNNIIFYHGWSISDNMIQKSLKKMQYTVL